GRGRLHVEREQVPASLGGGLAAGGLDEDAAHGLGRGGEEVTAAIPALGVLAPDQTEVRLMDQGSWLESLARLLAREARGGQLPQLVVHKREQLGRGVRVAGLDRRQDLRDIGHTDRVDQLLGAERFEKEGHPALPPPGGYRELSDVSFLAARSISRGPKVPWQAKPLTLRNPEKPSVFHEA